MTNHREKQEKAVLQHQALEHLGKVWHSFHTKLSQTGLLRVHDANDLIVNKGARPFHPKYPGKSKTIQ